MCMNQGRRSEDVPNQSATHGRIIFQITQYYSKTSQIFPILIMYFDLFDTCFMQCSRIFHLYDSGLLYWCQEIYFEATHDGDDEQLMENLKSSWQKVRASELTYCTSLHDTSTCMGKKHNPSCHAMQFKTQEATTVQTSWFSQDL